MQDLKVRLVAVDGGFKVVIDKSTTSLRGMEVGSERAKKALTGLNSTTRNLLLTLTAGASAWLSFRGASTLVRDFAVQEKAVAALDQSIASMGRTTVGLSRNLQALAAQIQREGIIGDEAIIQGQSFLTTYRDITDDLLPRATRLMVDLAAKMGGDVTGAANMVGKASMGMVGELARVGITFSDAAKESKDFALILSEMETQVSGMNKALGATRTGGLQGLQNDLGDTRELLGGLIAQVLGAATPGLRELVGVINNDLAEAVEGNQEAAEMWGRQLVVAAQGGVQGMGWVIEHMGKTISVIEDHPEIAQFGLIGYLIWGKKGAVIGALIGGLFSEVRAELRSLGVFANTTEEHLDAVVERIDRMQRKLGDLEAVGDPVSAEAIVALRAELVTLRTEQADLEAQLKSEGGWDAWSQRMQDAEAGADSFGQSLERIGARLRGLEITIPTVQVPLALDGGTGGGGRGGGGISNPADVDRLMRTLYPNEAAAKQWLIDYRLLVGSGLEGTELDDAIKRLNQRFAGEVKGDAKVMSDEVAQIYKDTATSIRGAFRDTFRDVFDDGVRGFSGLSDRMLGIFKDMLADMATLAIARPVMIPMVSAIGGMMGISNPAQAAVVQQLGGNALGSVAGGAMGAMGVGGLAAGTTAFSNYVAAQGIVGGSMSSLGFAGSALGAGQFGAAAGAALPVIGGIAIGAMLLDNLTGGGLFGTSWKTRDAGLDLAVAGGDISGQEYEYQRKKRSLFRGSKSRTLFSDIDDDLLTGINDSLDAGIEALIAGAAGLGVRTAEGIIAGFESQTRLSLKGMSDEEAQQAIQAWLDETLVDMGRAVLGDTRFSGLLIDAGREMLMGVFGIGGYMNADPMADFTEMQRLASRTLKEQYDEQTRSLRQLVRAYDGSEEATVALAVATQDRYQMELALLQQIAGVRAGIGDLIGGSIENIRQSVMSPDELFGYLTGQAEGLAGQLARATDPAQIERLVQQIDRLTNQAYGLLPDFSREENAQGFIDFLSGVRDQADDRLGRVEDRIQAAHESMSEAIGDSMARASKSLLEAAIAQKEASIATIEAQLEGKENRRLFQILYRKQIELLEEERQHLDELRSYYRYT